MHPTQNNPAAFLFGQTALKPRSVGAGVGSSGSELNGVIFDRLESGVPFALGAALFLFGTCTLASGQTLSVAANLQDGDNSGLSDAEDFGDAYATAVVVTASGGALTDEPFCVKLPFDLSGAKRYIRSQQTFTLSASGSDTAAVGALLALGGLEHNPPATGY
jgi:hypothetical protein